MGETARARARGQWLHAPGGDVLAHLLAVQAQDVRTPALALGARGGELDGSMRIAWLMRTTLHLVHAADLEWLHPLFAPRQVVSNARRLKQLGVTSEQADHAVELIAERVPAARPELASHLGAHGIPVAGQAIAHLVHRAALRGRVALTPDRVFVALTLPPAESRDAALSELARRYYACHAGATADDLAYWSGLPARDVREPASTPWDPRPRPARVVARLRRAAARLARPHADRPRRARPRRPPGRRHHPPGGPRERRRRGHLVVARRVCVYLAFT